MKKMHKRTQLGIQIKDIMTRDVATINPKASVAEAAILMRDRDVGMLPVCDGETLQGILTDRDITVRAVANGLNLKKTMVLEVMTPEVVYSFEHEDVGDALDSMEQCQIRRQPVLNRGKRLVGVLSLGDIAVDTCNVNAAGEAFRQVCAPEQTARM